jgi:hypothetical protein
MQLAGWVQAVAALVQAVAAVAIVKLTLRLNRLTQGYAQAAEDQAKASAEQAKASAALAELAQATLQAAQTYRELDWRPYLVLSEACPPGMVKNIGRGPALNGRALRLVHQDANSEEWAWIGSQSFAVGSNDSTSLEWLKTAVKAGTQEGPEGTIRLYCEDQFGNRYEFRRHWPSPEICKHGEDQPTWVATAWHNSFLIAETT